MMTYAGMLTYANMCMLTYADVYEPHHTIGDESADDFARDLHGNTSLTYADVCCRMLTVYGRMLTYADLAGELGTALTQDSRR